ncbi:protein phosphatase CheZ [Rhodopila sp.]|uniref:protein phosphatase CheZ n=1 Tax=Rhodopila sp. TaxID=2480087 RepID=UPI002C8EB430|nr:protein phosphatase CheZ [Rhodopila sp.]HVZ06811.1 protein phosphatase CheZ [Rhodopila sp.]
MLDSFGLTGIDALKNRLAEIRAQKPELDPEMLADVVRAVLTTISDELSAKEASLLQEVEDLARTIAAARTEIAALHVEDITGRAIPLATDELDAIVDHTAQATHAILTSCEILDEVADTIDGAPAERLQEATTRIYEACGFQDITGQRITKIVAALKAIDAKVAHIIATFGPAMAEDHFPEDRSPDDRSPEDRSSTDRARIRTRPVTMPGHATATETDGLLNGPQLPEQAMDQSDIDKLLASFE